MLARLHPHPRDVHISFEESTHQYTVGSCHPRSVTTVIHSFFPHFDPDKVIKKMQQSASWTSSKYYPMTAQQIKDKWQQDGQEASQAGTALHLEIERYLNQEQPLNPDLKELKLFLHFWAEWQKKSPYLRPYRTEWWIYDREQKIAGSIDCVLRDERDGQLIIVDWKRSKEIKMCNRFEKGKGPFAHLDHCNYNHYSLQLNFYRHMLENWYGHRVKAMMIVVLHPQQEQYQYYLIDRIELGQIWDQL